MAIVVRFQFYDAVEGANPGKCVGSRGSGHFGMEKAETAGVMSRGVGRIREGLHPRFESGSVGRTELDIVEKMSSGPWDPRLGDEATCLERSQFIVQMASNEVEDL